MRLGNASAARRRAGVSRDPDTIGALCLICRCRLNPDPLVRLGSRAGGRFSPDVDIIGTGSLVGTLSMPARQATPPLCRKRAFRIMHRMTANESLRERKKHQARLELVRSAVTLFRGQGYEATTVEQIASQANLSSRTFFRFFGSKEDVVFVDIPLLAAKFRKKLEEPHPGSDPWSVVREALKEQTVAFTTVAPELELQCVQLWFAEPTLRRRYAQILGEWEEIAAAYLHNAWGSAFGVEAKVAGCALIGVARTVVEEQAATEREIRELLDRGFRLLDPCFATTLSAR